VHFEKRAISLSLKVLPFQPRLARNRVQIHGPTPDWRSGPTVGMVRRRASERSTRWTAPSTTV